MRRAIGLAVLGVALCSHAAGAWAYGAENSGAAAGGQASEGAARSAYAALCVRERLRCTLTYDDQPRAQAEKKSIPPAESRSAYPLFSLNGTAAVVLALAALIAAIFLWMRFGNGGVILSRAPQDIKRQHVRAPDAWEAQWAEDGPRSGSLLDRLMAMTDQRQALIQLLRHCLLHAADISNTPLARSDTERAVFARLPATLPGRQDLKVLLDETERAHYGGLFPAQDRVQALFAAARGLLPSQ